MDGGNLPHQPTTRTARLAALFKSKPNVWLEGVEELAAVAGKYAWRTRLSELRRAPFHMNIRNRQRRVRAEHGASYVISEYMCVCQEEKTEPVAEVQPKRLKLISSWELRP
jgi:hypothetical protein